MELKEILEAQGLTPEQVEAVTASMKENKIYTASQENLDVRYEKLKTKHDELNTQVTNANNVIEELKKNNTDNEALQASLEKYKTDYEALKIESETKVQNVILDNAIKAMMKQHKAKEKYEELLTGKIDKSALKIDEKGAVTGLEEVFTGLKTEYEDLFLTDKLGGNPPPNNGSSATETAALEELVANSIFKK